MTFDSFLDCIHIDEVLCVLWDVFVEEVAAGALDAAIGAYWGPCINCYLLKLALLIDEGLETCMQMFGSCRSDLVSEVATLLCACI
jgi:hypothetical protein